LTQYKLIIEKSERFINSAKLLAEHGDYDSAASRLYYAMLYVAEALLEAQGLSFSSHRGVISAFGQHFTKPGKIDSRFHKALLAGFSQRQMGDYRFDSDLAQEDIDQMILDASEFLKVARIWLQSSGLGNEDEK